MAGAELPDELPEEWIEQAECAIRGAVPTTFSEPSLGAGDGDDAARRSRPRSARSSGSGSRMTTRTKLVCTLGPATNTPKFIRGLVTAGAPIFRINFSHGTPADHARAVGSCGPPRRKVDRALWP